MNLPRLSAAITVCILAQQPFATAAPGDVAAGKNLFSQSCSACHAQNGAQDVADTAPPVSLYGPRQQGKTRFHSRAIDESTFTDARIYALTPTNRRYYCLPEICFDSMSFAACDSPLWNPWICNSVSGIRKN